MAEGKSEEHSLEYQELFNEYLLIFEGKLEEFIGQPQLSAYVPRTTQHWHTRFVGIQAATHYVRFERS